MDKQGFTLVEIIVVIIVLGIMVSISVPNYNIYITEGKVAHIRTDMEGMQGLIKIIALDGEEEFKGNVVDRSLLFGYIAEKKIFKNGNKVEKEIDIEDPLYEVKSSFVKDIAKSKLKGNFYIDEKLDLYYVVE